MSDLSIWQDLTNDIAKILNVPIEVHIPSSLDEKCINWFQKLDTLAFNVDLRYTLDELKERWNHEHHLLVFVLSDVMSDQLPIAMMMGYESPTGAEFFYLDTLAVVIEGKGIGKVMVKQLIKWAKVNNFTGIRLDTELLNIHGVQLVTFYEKLGFKKTNEDSKGDITLEIFLG
ncbi:MAG: GNAT family N-acetyltransferase [Candidatus Odinarchaeota archaeon]